MKTENLKSYLIDALNRDNKNVIEMANVINKKYNIVNASNNQELNDLKEANLSLLKTKRNKKRDLALFNNSEKIRFITAKNIVNIIENYIDDVKEYANNNIRLCDFAEDILLLTK